MRTLRLLGRDMENGILRRCVLFYTAVTVCGVADT